MTTSSATKRQESSRHAVFLPSVFWSPSRPDFYAVTSRLCPEGIQFRSAVVPGSGERLTCSIGHVGTIEVEVGRIEEKAFTVRPVADRRHNAAVARMLVELAERQTPHSGGHGTSPRIVPRRSEVTVTLGDGRILTGRIVQVSVSGADVHLGVSIDVGTRLRLGTTDAVVAHAYGNGIGAYFLSPLDPEALNESLVL